MSNAAPANTARIAAVGALLATVGLLLSACTPVSRVFARLDGDEVQFLVCEHVEADAFEVSVAPGSTVEWRSAWRTEGSSTEFYGQVLSFGVEPNRWRTALGPDELDIRTQDIGVTVWVGQGAVHSVAIDGRRIQAGGGEGPRDAAGPSEECLVAAAEDD